MLHVEFELLVRLLRERGASELRIAELRGAYFRCEESIPEERRSTIPVPADDRASTTKPERRTSSSQAIRAMRLDEDESDEE